MKVLPPLIALFVLLILWEGFVRTIGIAAYLLPPPTAVLVAAHRHAGELLRAAAMTGQAAVWGFALSAGVGMVAAVILASSKPLEKALYPYTVFLQTVPIIAIAPLLVLWFGPGLRAVAVSAFVVSVFPVIANTLAGLRSVELALLDMFRRYNASPVATLFKLKLPSALPNIVTGLRIASGLAVIGAIVGEFVAGFSEGSAGLGILVLSAYRQLRTDLLFAAVLMASMLGLCLFGIISVTGARLLRRWHASERRDEG